MNFVGGRRTLVHSVAFASHFRPSVTSRITAKTLRDMPMVTMESLLDVTTSGLLKGPISNPYDQRPHLFYPNWVLTTPSQNLHRKLLQNGARYNGGLYCHSLWEHTIALPNSSTP